MSVENVIDWLVGYALKILLYNINKLKGIRNMID